MPIALVCVKERDRNLEGEGEREGERETDRERELERKIQMSWTRLATLMQFSLQPYQTPQLLVPTSDWVEVPIVGSTTSHLRRNVQFRKVLPINTLSLTVNFLK